MIMCGATGRGPDGRVSAGRVQGLTRAMARADVANPAVSDGPDSL
jgi:hypothetical protein